MNLNPKRGKDESFKNYKKRRKFGNFLIKHILRGKRIKQTKKELFKIQNNVF